ncbi:PAS domain-containing protein [Tianweitania sp. BSSL-BM11]|uniref:Blue-light-activated histidine kinase n=1 Tax=Tianweitania aestuarii TaxID=2814886 RepID=A0ABS5RXK0_9HYPH|nr:PAS domain-containing protein [Tianweitania aestuarii]MBS9721753.1 PAS domain-containing protein [Tianweitania aestuarii]
MHNRIIANDRTKLPQHMAESFMHDLIDGFDWSKTPLGPVSSWPEAIGTTVRFMLASDTPMALLLGPEGVLLFNDGYAEFAGARYKTLIGLPAVDAWPEVADFNRDNVVRLSRGETFSYKEMKLQLNRTGELTDVWLDLEYIPITDRTGEVLGGFCIVQDITERMETERALAASRETMSFALDAAGIVGTWDWNIPDDIITADRHFAELYGVDPVVAARGTPIGTFFDGIHPADRKSVQAWIETAIARCGPFRGEYRVRDRDGVEHWVLAVGHVFCGPSGEATRLPGISVEITERKATEMALIDSEARFRAIADTMPQMVWSTRPDGYHDYYNARWYEFTGMPEGSTDGEEWNGMFHPDDQERAFAQWRHCLATGDPYEIEYRLRHRSGQYRWTLGRALPVHDAEGAIMRWFGTCTDIHESKIAAVEREIVAQELSHRIKNIFAVLTGLVSLSGREHPELAPVVGELRQRIAALGRAHDFVRPHSHVSRVAGVETTMHALVSDLLSPYATNQNRLVFRGEDVPIDDRAATPLALLFHELATNAAKYGALANSTGSIALETRIDAPSETYRMTWIESGGPSVAEGTTPSGFGTKLMALSVNAQMGGTLSPTFSPNGLRMEIAIPLRSLTRVYQSPPKAEG